MKTEPRDPAVAALARATVRVGKGSGVVVYASVPLIATAAHVLPEDEVPTAWKGSIFGEAPILVRDLELDVALLTPPHQLEGLAIHLADDDACRPGDPIWAAGFPRGWKETDPVIAPGTIAGLGEESWVNIDGTWGNSGGPICQISEGVPRVSGVLLGRAGEVNRALDQFRKEATAGQIKAQLLEEQIANPSPAVKLNMQAIQAHTALAREMADLLEQHFRTGFLRFAPVADVRKLLGSAGGVSAS